MGYLVINPTAATAWILAVQTESELSNKRKFCFFKCAKSLCRKQDYLNIVKETFIPLACRISYVVELYQRVAQWQRWRRRHWILWLRSGGGGRETRDTGTVTHETLAGEHPCHEATTRWQSPGEVLTWWHRWWLSCGRYSDERLSFEILDNITQSKTILPLIATYMTDRTDRVHYFDSCDWFGYFVVRYCLHFSARVRCPDSHSAGRPNNSMPR